MKNETNEKHSNILDHSDVTMINLHGREIILVGTAHISADSVELIQSVLEETNPDHVGVELDDRRLENLRNPDRWKNLNLKEVIRQKQLTALIANLVLSSYQKRLSGGTGVKPGSELLTAVESAEAKNIDLSLIDRDIRITLKRTWRNTPFLKKMSLISVLIGSIFEKESISEEQLEELRQQDVMGSMLDEMGQHLPSLRHSLISERDQWMAEKIRQTAGDRVVGVVGAGHVPGMKRILETGEKVDLAELEKIPPASPLFKIIAWSIPALIIGSIVFAGTKDWDVAKESAGIWFLANAIPCALGAIIAGAHPLVILAGAIAAPFTSLTPVIGAAYVTGFLQAWLKPPTVQEFETVAEDIGVFKRWWKNKVLRIFLAFILPGLGSFIGSVFGGVKVFENLFDVLN